MKKSHIIAIIIIAVAIGAVLSTVADSSTYVTFETAEANPGKEYHVVGQLNRDRELIYEPEVNANLFSFYLIDNNQVERKVTFNGAKPQDFERSEQIVITGKMAGDEFMASKILMKCPSKYTGNEQQIQEFEAAG